MNPPTLGIGTSYDFDKPRPFDTAHYFWLEIYLKLREEKRQQSFASQFNNDMEGAGPSTANMQLGSQTRVLYDSLSNRDSRQNPNDAYGFYGNSRPLAGVASPTDPYYGGQTNDYGDHLTLAKASLPDRSNVKYRYKYVGSSEYNSNILPFEYALPQFFGGSSSSSSNTQQDGQSGQSNNMNPRNAMNAMSSAMSNAMAQSGYFNNRGGQDMMSNSMSGGGGSRSIHEALMQHQPGSSHDRYGHHDEPVEFDNRSKQSGNYYGGGGGPGHHGYSGTGTTTRGNSHQNSYSGHGSPSSHSVRSGHGTPGGTHMSSHYDDYGSSAGKFTNRGGFDDEGDSNDMSRSHMSHYSTNSERTMYQNQGQGYQGGPAGGGPSSGANAENLGSRMRNNVDNATQNCRQQ